MPMVQVTVQKQGGQEQQMLFRTPVNSSFVDHKLEQLHGPGLLCLEGSNAVLAATEELQPAEAYVYQVSAGAAAAAEEAAVARTIQDRLPCTSKYASYVSSSSNGVKEAAVVVDSHHVATYRHQDHALWSTGQAVEVYIHAGNSDQPRCVIGSVVHVDERADLVLIKVPEALAAPVLDAQVFPGQQYYVLGQSAQAQGDASSVSHGIMAATQLDAHSHVRGDIMAGLGDSGAGCFAVQTGRLIGMVVGVDHVAHKSVLVPAAVIAHTLSMLTAS